MPSETQIESLCGHNPVAPQRDKEALAVLIAAFHFAVLDVFRRREAAPIKAPPEWLAVLGDALVAEAAVVVGVKAHQDRHDFVLAHADPDARIHVLKRARYWRGQPHAAPCAGRKKAEQCGHDFEPAR